ncbi:MAG: hypothetical protein RBR42_11230 [Desulfomicrobium sp.]|jgi:hypothetical protein|nr:hypothetical protein [Desulfomicrobium sp.]NLV96766.1 hypothetical protein [Desulfovibrionales bacterium]
MQDSYPIKDTFNQITDTLHAALATDYVIGLLIAVGLIAFILGRLSK